jgi:hypothetical protein
MKKLTLIIALFFVIFTSGLMAQIKVNSSGYVGINNTSPTYRLDVAGNVKFVNSGKTITFEGYSFGPSSSTGISLGSTSNYWGSVWATSAFFTNPPTITSDINFKENITDLSSMSDKLKLLRPVTYKLKTEVSGLFVDKDKNNTQYGFLAQELQKIFPEMVTSQENGILGIQYTELIPVLVQALKEQQDQIDLLNKRIKVLENTLK